MQKMQKNVQTYCNSKKMLYICTPILGKDYIFLRNP